MQASDPLRGVKRAVKVEDDHLRRVLKKARNDAIPVSDPKPALLSPIADNLLRPQNTPSSAAQASPSYVVHSFPAPAPLDVTGSPPYAYFVWNVQPRATTAARKRKSPSCSTSSPGIPIATTDTGPGQASVSAPSPVFSAASTSSGEPQTVRIAEPRPPIPTQLEPQLEHRQAALLAHLDTRYAFLLGEDARRRAAFQEAAFARAVEIDVEERWARHLKQMVLSTISPLVPSAPSLATLSSPSSFSSSSPSSSSSSFSGLTVLPLAPSPMQPPQYGRLLHTHNHQYSPCSDEQQRERAYLYQVIGHTDQYISALRDAQRVAFEREATEAQLAERALQELQARRQRMVADRALEVQSAGAALAMWEACPVRCARSR